jgi:hypothetical protein
MLAAMSANTLPSVAAVGQRINARDYPHKLAMVVLVPEDRTSWSLAVANASTGEVLAWDGVYPVEVALSDEFTRSLMDYDWNGWDDMPSKLILDANGYWLGVITEFLAPSYSVDVCAARALINWFRDADPLKGQRTVAYYPCNLEHVIAGVQAEMKFTSGVTLGGLQERQDLLLAKLRSL